jgi:hypothetical protein
MRQRSQPPISLIHLVDKVFAKMLSLRLAPKLNDLVSKNRNGFIPGRSLHNNFVLARNRRAYCVSFENPGYSLSSILPARLIPSLGLFSSRSCANMDSVTGSSFGLRYS